MSGWSEWTNSLNPQSVFHRFALFANIDLGEQTVSPAAHDRSQRLPFEQKDTGRLAAVHFRPGMEASGRDPLCLFCFFVFSPFWHECCMTLSALLRHNIYQRGLVCTPAQLDTPPRFRVPRTLMVFSDFRMNPSVSFTAGSMVVYSARVTVWIFWPV